MLRSFVQDCAVLLFLSLALPGGLAAQRVCEEGNGPLNPAQPTGMAPADIVQKFVAREKVLKSARDRYGYTLNVTVQTLDDSDRVDGEYRQDSEFALSDTGGRVERTTFAPESTLRKISLSERDIDDIHERIPFPIQAEDVPFLSITYAGRQHVDQLDTYVFNVAPKDSKKMRTLFEGRVWVDDRELVIVKSCGRPRPNEVPKRKNEPASVTPVFVTYREQVDDQMWFPTYSKADAYLHFPGEHVHIREIVKYTNYKLLAGK